MTGAPAELVEAAGRGDLDAVRALLDGGGADLGLADRDGITPLEHARRLGYGELARILQPGTVIVRPSRESDLAWAQGLLDARLGGRLQARRGELVDVLALPGFVAEADGRRVGLLTYRREGGGVAELAVVVATEQHRGIGTALVEALTQEVADCDRIWLVTTNDNLEALRFYQRRGFRLSALRPGALDEARRRLKPEIGEVGAFGIPIRDELELELRLR